MHVAMDSHNGGEGRATFASTNWSVVVAAGGAGPRARLALEELCLAYWYPLYAYMRRQGTASHNAEDLVQSFFAFLVEKQVVGHADPQRGRFRSFLLTAFKQFLARQAEHASAAKRKPEQPLVSMDAEGASRFELEPFHELTPDRQYNYAWALALLERVLERLRAEYARDGKDKRFEALKGCLTGQQDVSGRDQACDLGMTEGSVRVAVHRLKQRYGEMLREEIGQTLESPADIDAELAELMLALNPGRP
jgi:DNA-directed RNA polymerase specialized sigma24 family protein